MVNFNLMKSKGLVLILAFLFFCAQSISNMITIPFHDFDEAHRAEGARNMRLNNYYISPLVGGPYNHPGPHSQLSPETGRPPLVFNLMAVFSGLFGDYEWAYRLPSFIFGILGFICLFLFIRLFEKKYSWLALSISLLSFLTAYDWWHSLQMAHLDTAVSLFTCLALFFLILFIKNKKRLFLAFSGLALGLAILSKGPPAIIFLFPLPYLIFTKKIKIKNLFLLFIIAFLTILPWYIPLSLEHGFDYFFRKYIGGYVVSPSSTKIGGGDPTQDAPIFWYLRWWFDTFRPGIVLFGAFFLWDLIKKKLSWTKLTLLFYIVGGFGLFSYAKSKVWWYVLPVIPAVCAYLYFSIKDYLIENKTGVVNLSLVILLSSLPFFLFKTNTVSLAYGLSVTLLSFLILVFNWKNLKFVWNFGILEFWSFLLPVILVISFLSFYSHFPIITPTHWETKYVGQFFTSLPNTKCLWVEEDMPYEAILYYSQVRRTKYWNEDSQLTDDCVNYLVSDKKVNFGDLIYQNGPVRLYRL